jgi:hypothetical protein
MGGAVERKGMARTGRWEGSNEAYEFGGKLAIMAVGAFQAMWLKKESV